MLFDCCFLFLCWYKYVLLLMLTGERIRISVAFCGVFYRLHVSGCTVYLVVLS